MGLKPSRGRVSFSPVSGEAWAGFATSGPIARSVRDVAMFLDVLAGPVVGDPYWAPPPSEPFSAAVSGVRRSCASRRSSKAAESKVDPEVTAATESALKAFQEMGHTVEQVKLDPANLLLGVSGVIIPAGIASVPVENVELMDPVVRSTWEPGKDVKAADYINAIAQMHNICRDIMQKLAPYDALITPTLTRPAVRLGTLPSNLEGRTARAVRMAVVHVSVQRDRPAGVLIAEWIFESGIADRASDRRPPKRRGGHHRARRAVRGSAPVEG